MRSLSPESVWLATGRMPNLCPLAASFPGPAGRHVYGRTEGCICGRQGERAQCIPIHVGTWCTRLAVSCPCTPNVAHRSFPPIGSDGPPPGSRTTTALTATPICGSSSCRHPWPGSRQAILPCSWSPTSPAKSCSPSRAHATTTAQRGPSRARSPPPGPRRRTPRSARAATAAAGATR